MSCFASAKLSIYIKKIRCIYKSINKTSQKSSGIPKKIRDTVVDFLRLVICDEMFAVVGKGVFGPPNQFACSAA